MASDSREEVMPLDMCLVTANMQNVGEAVFKPRTRIVELDILRAVAIIVVLVGHFPYYLPTVEYSRGFTLFASCGVALFLFISGFVLYLNHPSFPQCKSLAYFYKKRVLRIYPLYWFALFLTLVIAAGLSNPLILLSVGLGLQGFLSPRFGTDLEGYFWFIGAIVVFYTIYPLIALLASDTLRLPAPVNTSVFKFVIMLIVPFLILLTARGALSLIANNVFAYYGAFALGVATSKYNIFGRYVLLTDNRTRLLKYVAVAAVSMTALLVVYFLLHPFENVSTPPAICSNVGDLIEVNALWILFILLMFCLARIMVISSSKASKPLSRTVWYRTLLLISFSSYAIYLFFGLILHLTMNALAGAQLTALEIDMIQIFVGLPTVVLVAYLLQSTQNEIVNRVRKYRTTSAPLLLESK